ncbi:MULTISPECIES: glycosyltransferase [unclassified Duganella]|uniref:glycosyltransferase n=1 Tax=unclassified Duganella TaxID=2636909 RepID=UPI001314CC10|nr:MULTISPECIES: glycosyltransferase [unclassified Duganella]
MLSQPESYRDIVDYLRDQGAQVTLVGPDTATHNIRGKAAIVKAMLSPRLLRARRSWGAADRVLVVGWQALPLLALIKLRLLPRPAKLLVMACFIHGKRARSVVNRAWRLLRFPGMGFITFSEGEARNLVNEVGMPPAAVHFHLWRQALDGQAAPDAIADDGYIFSGGFSNRDYDLLLEAAGTLAAPLVVVASAHNQINPAGAATTVYRDLPEAQFEALLAKSRVVAMPLKSQGEACGQSVLLRVLRNGKPLIATRHEAIEAYLGAGYAGFVPHGDAPAMAAALQRALEEPAFRAELAAAITQANRQLAQADGPGQEIARYLQA